LAIKKVIFVVWSENYKKKIILISVDYIAIVIKLMAGRLKLLRNERF